jgi:subtilase family serine protease
MFACSPAYLPNKSYLSVLISAALMSIALSGCGGGTVQEIDSTNAPVATEDGSNTATALAVVEPEMLPMAAVGNTQTLGTVSGNVGLKPHQIRARYGFNSMTTPAEMGSGTTIAIVTAYNNPTAALDINKFSQVNGLPGCTVAKTTMSAATGNINTPAKVPGAGCTFQVINVDTNGRPSFYTRRGVLTETVPGVDYRWQFESSLDIEWAHAIAPMANIVLIQANAAFPTALSSAVRYAATIADVVSMSWGQFESGFTSACGMTRDKITKLMRLIDPKCTTYSNTQTILFGPANPRDPVTGAINYTAGGYDTQAFSNPNATYVAASGDWGYKPMWPSVSSKVLAVGGTNNAGADDTGWSGSGGGVSTYYPSPSYQAGMGYTTRAVPDVSLGADSKSPVAVYVTPGGYFPDTACVKANGAANCGWYAGYGTSAAAPQWAGLVAITKAVRNEQFKASINFLPSIYAAASTPGQYAVLFDDVLLGNNGYSAKAGYDLVTGWGTPNAKALVRYLGSF